MYVEGHGDQDCMTDRMTILATLIYKKSILFSIHAKLLEIDLIEEQ